MRPLVIFLAAVAAFSQQADYNTGLKNQPAWPSSAYNFTPVSFTSTISSGTYKTFSFSRCPAGVKGTNLGPAVNITGAANNGSGAIRITTAANGFTASDRVTIAGVGGTTEANGNWSITVISTTQFDLVGSTFANAYTSGGTAKQNVHYLYLSGGVGTAEIVPIGGGTCSSPGIAGTIQAYVANSHSGTYTLGPANGGIMEALWAQTSDSRAVLISNSPTIYGPVWLTTSYQVDLYGRGRLNTVLTRASNYAATIILVDQAGISAGSSLVTLHDFWVYAPNMNASAGEGAVKFRNITCCGSSIYNVNIWDDRNGVIVDSSDNINIRDVHYQQTATTAQPNSGLLVTQSTARFGGVSSNIFISGGEFQTGEGISAAGTNVLQNGILVESADGLTVTGGTYLRGEYGIRFNPAVTTSGLLVDSAVIDKCRNSAIAIGASASTAQGQIVVKGSWLTGNYAAGQPLVTIDMTNMTTGRFIFDDNDIAGATGSCVSLVNAKKVKFQDNTIVSCDQGATGKYGIEVLTAAEGIDIHDNTFFDLASLGSTTQYGVYLNANITNSSIHDNNIGTMQGASFLYQAGTNSNLKVTNNITTESIPGATVSASNIAYATNLPPIVSLTGGGTATSVTGMWPGLKYQVITGSATTFNTGGSNPGDFARSLTTAAGQMVTFEMLAGGQVYVY